MYDYKIRDPFILGAVAGILGNGVKMLGNYINKSHIKFSSATYPEIAGGIFMSRKERKKRTGKAVGVLADFSLGSLLGIPMVYILKYTGPKNATLKGLALGHFAWLTMYGGLGKGFGTKGVFPLDAGTNLSAFINHSTYGMVTANVIKYLGDPKIFATKLPKAQIVVSRVEKSLENSVENNSEKSLEKSSEKLTVNDL